MDEKVRPDGEKVTKSWLAHEIGVAQSTAEMWFINESMPNVIYLDRICKLFGVSLDFIVRGEENAKPKERKLYIR